MVKDVYCKHAQVKLLERMGTKRKVQCLDCWKAVIMMENELEYGYDKL